MNYRTLTEFSEIKEYLQGASVVAFDFETAPNDEYRAEDKAALDAHKSHIVGISFSTAEGDAIYVPLAHRAGGNIENQPKVWEFLSAQLFENKCVIKVAHNLAFESMLLYARGIVVQSPCYDTIAASQMTLKSKFEFRGLHDSGLKLLAASLFGAEMPSFSTVTDGRHFDEMNPADFETVRYACADSDYTLRLYHKFNNWFDRFLPQHRTIVEQLESPTAVYCGMMKYNGIPVDRERMLQKQSEANVRSAELKAEIDAITGGVNIGANASTSAFKQYLFRDLGLPIMKLTEKEQEAADDASMQMLKEHCEKAHPELVRLFEAVQEYRKWEKLRSTYVDGYLSHINSATGCIHPDIMPLGTQTGRFAARNPNMQNCFDDQTEILTPRGFVRFLELTGTDTVAQWENGEIYFVKPDEIIAQDYEGDMVCIKNQHIDLCMTPEHRCLLQNRKNRQYRVVAAKDYGKDDKQLQAAQYHFGGQHLTPAQITLLAATQADGNYHDGGIDFVFSKARKYRRLLQAIQTADVPYSDHVRANGQVVIRLLKSQCTQWIMDMLGREKTWNCRLLDLDRQSVKGLLAEIVHWDGCFTRSNYYSSSIKTNADWMQILYSLTGSRAHLREYDNGNPNAAINYQLDVTDRDYSLTANVDVHTVPYSGKVYCVSVPSGFIMVRRNGQAIITGNCPRKTNDPVGVRNFIAAPEGQIIMSLDFSQIELRVGAFYCRDARMLETYRNGGDIHAQTTSVIFHVPFEVAVDKTAPDYKEHRTIAKNCNFGVFYGLFPRGLQRTLRFKAGLNTDLDTCTEIIANLKKGYSGLTSWQEETKKRAAETCYAETWLGRRRYLIGMRSEDWSKRSFAERCALNTPIQGTAADILKTACGRIIAGMPERPWLKPILQIHDELVFLLPEEKLTESMLFVKECMEQQPYQEFDVPIVAEASAGYRFGEMKEWEELDL